MPNAIFEVELPDGKILEIEAPADTSPDTIKQRAKQYRYEAMKAEIDRKNGTDGGDPTAGMSTFDKVAAGAGKSLYDTWRGIKQLTGNMSREEVDREKQLDAALMKTGAGKAGYIGGTVASIVGPGVGLKAGAAVPQLARSAPALSAAARAFLPNTVKGAALQGGAIGAMQPVGTGESRGMNAAGGMAGGTIGAGAPRLLGMTARAAKAPFAGMTAKGA